jgi:hypothetical protein
MQPPPLDFHIRENDYFGTLATVLDLLRQDLSRQGYKRHSVLLTRLRDELLFLQKNHHIEQDALPS